MGTRYKWLQRGAIHACLEFGDHAFIEQSRAGPILNDDHPDVWIKVHLTLDHLFSPFFVNWFRPSQPSPLPIVSFRIQSAGGGRIDHGLAIQIIDLNEDSARVDITASGNVDG